MRKLFLLLILAPVFCFGQTVDDGVNIITTGRANSSYSIRASDTIPIIYLYSDTSLYKVDVETMTKAVKRNAAPPTVRDYSCKWEFGYLTFKRDGYYLKYTYLDQYKKPLKNKYVVWYYKEI